MKPYDSSDDTGRKAGEYRPASDPGPESGKQDGGGTSPSASAQNAGKPGDAAGQRWGGSSPRDQYGADVPRAPKESPGKPGSPSSSRTDSSDPRTTPEELARSADTTAESAGPRRSLREAGEDRFGGPAGAAMQAAKNKDFLLKRDGQLRTGDAVVDNTANATKGTAQALNDKGLSNSERTDRVVDQLPKAGVAAAGAAAQGFGVPKPVVDATAPLAGKALEKTVDKAKPVLKPALKPLVSTSRKLWVMAKVAIPVQIGLILFLIIGMVSAGSIIITGTIAAGRDTYLWDVSRETAEAKSIPAPYLEAYYEYGERYNVPWTLLAAVGGKATLHGRIDPYKQTVPSLVGSATAAGGPTPIEDPSSDQVAAAIYSQAVGLGLGEVAAFIGIGVGLGETGLQNDTDGDCWTAQPPCSMGRTSSRGVFQQFWSWPPPGTAWSGQKGPTGGHGTPYNQFNKSNAWGANGWAVSDPRMNVAQSANMFFLGPNYSATSGLEDNSLYQSLKDRDPLALSSSQMVQVAQQVQGFPVAHMGSYESNMTRAADYFKRIKSGKITVPAFVPPLEGMRKSATTSVTKQALDSGGTAPVAVTVAAPAQGNVASILLVGDSLSGGPDPATGSTTPLAGYGMSRELEALAKEKGIPYNALAQQSATTAKAAGWVASRKLQASTVVVALGTNDANGSSAAFAASLDKMMQAIGDGKRVYWVNVHCPGCSNVKGINEALDEAARNRWRDRLTVLDWKSYAEANGVRTTDKVHYAQESYRQMADFIMNNITGTSTSTLTGGGIAFTGGGELSGPGVLPMPEGYCPTLSPAVEGKSTRQGAGPLMLSRSALEARGIALGDGVQNICTSLDVVASALDQAARSVAEEEGLAYPSDLKNLVDAAENRDTNAASQLHDFWAKSMDRLDIFADTQLSVCAMPPAGTTDEDKWVARGIEVLWRCLLEEADLKSVQRVSLSDAGTSYSTLDKGQAVSRAIDEALDVAWSWSRWGQAECKESAQAAGVFPLTRAQFADFVPEEMAEQGRCDPEANIAAAAKLFSEGESTDPQSRGGMYRPLWGGWEAFSQVAGPPEVRAVFADSGPWSPPQLSLECSIRVQSFLDEVASLPENPGLGQQAADLSKISAGNLTGSALEESLLSFLSAALPNLQASPECSGLAGRAAADILIALTALPDGDNVAGKPTSALPVSSGNSTGLAQPGDARRAMLRVAAEASRKYTGTGVAAGQTALITRLSPILVSPERHPSLERPLTGSALTQGMEYVNIAVLYGGMFEGDKALAAAAGPGVALVGEGVPYAEEINAAGMKHKVDPRLLAALLEQESRFQNASCEDYPADRGAFGVLKLTVTEARELGVNPCKPDEVIEGVARYLRAVYASYRAAFSDAEDRDVWKAALVHYKSDAAAGRAFLADGVAGVQSYLRSCEAAWCGENKVREVTQFIADSGADSVVAKWEKNIAKFPAAPLTGVQMTVGPEGCPTAGPRDPKIQGWMHDGSDSIGLRQICIEAVAAAPTPQHAQAIIEALKYVSDPYVGHPPGAQPPASWDCSKLTAWAWNKAAPYLDLFPLTYTQIDQMNRIPASQARPGDLVFFFESGAHHVGMVLSDTWMVEAANPSAGVIVSDWTTGWSAIHFTAAATPRLK